MLKTKRSKISFLIILALLAVALGLFSVVRNSSRKNVSVNQSDQNFYHKKDINYDPATKADNTASDNKKNAAPGSTKDSASNPTNSNTPPVVTITRAGVIDGSLQVGVLVSNSTSGTCLLSLTQAGQQPISVTEPLALQASTYVCPAFSVALSKFPVAGNWDVHVTVSAPSGTTTVSWQANPIQISK